MTRTWTKPLVVVELAMPAGLIVNEKKETHEKTIRLTEEAMVEPGKKTIVR